ncbi:septum formation initiator family protein [Limosilactobacillus gastricus]|uniref:FtsB family cell division protein n=1 Tax=Limosilactobacillus gastricus TaxID=227942 RepID=UPI00031A2E3D|nr:septum formation initiator family protein [Limosilactobacillus gastricus]
MSQHKSQVIHLNNTYIQQVNHRRHVVRDTHVKRIKMILTLFAAVILFLGFELWQSHIELAQVNQSIVKTEQTIKSQKSRGQTIQEELKLLKNPDYVQQLVRQKYDYAKDGETLYKFVN